MAEKLTLDWQEYLDTARQAAAEGCVLLKKDIAVLRLNVGQNGLKLKSIKFDFILPYDELPENEKYPF